MRNSITITIILSLLCSCERDIDIRLKDAEPKLVVEATIENGELPYVLLTKSLSFYSSVDPSILSRTFVHNADVYMSNGSVTHKLKEYSVQVGQYTFYYYSGDPGDPASLFTGELMKQYSLRILEGGREYRATTSIPDTTRRIDTVYYKPAPAGNAPDARALMARFTDRPGFGDYIRYYTGRNSEPFYPGLNSVFDDQVIDGSTYEVQVERGVDRTEPRSEGFSYFRVGDTVTLKLCNIDKATYDFWRTQEFVYANQGNPFASPTKVLSNISGNALGYFGGYAAQYRTIIIRN